MSLPSETKKPSLPALSPEQLESVTGGSGVVLVPTEECPTCASGVDPTVQRSQFSSSLTSDL
jgi:hypothetical protein